MTVQNTYKPVVPEWVAKILEKDKLIRQNRRNPHFYVTGQERKDWEEWKERYSRKLKYARLNGWIVEEE